MDIKSILASFFALTLCLHLEVVYADDRKEESFFVKPGAGTLSVEHEVNQYKCKFTYSAFGGTHELNKPGSIDPAVPKLCCTVMDVLSIDQVEWAFSTELIDGGAAVMCTVERGIASYLFFEHFKLELTGPFASITEVDIKTSQKDNKSLQPSEYIHGKTEVSSTGQFKNHLEKVAVYSPLPRVDL